MSKDKKIGEPGKFRQLLVALIANISSLSVGMLTGWQSPTIPQLQSENPPVGKVPMTDEAVSWLTGIMCLAAAGVSLVVGAVANKLGRKTTGCLMAVPLCASWLFVIFATNQTHLFFARFFAGMSAGMTLYLVPLYVSEIASDGIRGMLGSLLIFVLNTGILLGYILGAVLSYNACSIVSFVFPLLYIALFLFTPESPVYLVRHNRHSDAARLLSWLRGGHKPTVEREMLRIQAEVKEMNVPGQKIRLSDLFRDQATVKGLIISLGLFGGQQFAGIMAVLSYTETIFKLSGSSLRPEMSAIVVGAIQVFGSCLSTSLVERAGRRMLLLTSSMGMAVCHYILGTFCYLQALQYDVTSFSWISVIALSVYMIAYGFGLGPGPYIVSSEILGRDVSSMTMTISMWFAWSMAFLVVKLFPGLVMLLGVHGCFYLLGTSCIFTFVFVFLLIPETKGLPRQVILDRLNGIRDTFGEERYASSGNVTEKSIPIPEIICEDGK